MPAPPTTRNTPVLVEVDAVVLVNIIAPALIVP